MLDRHILDPLATPARSCSLEWIFSSTELQQRITYKTRRNVDKRLVIIILRMAHATAAQDTHRKLNEVELH